MFYSWDLYSKVVVEDPFVSYELDRLIEASPASASVLDIIDAFIVLSVVLLNIAAIGDIFIIVANVVDVILSSRTSEQRHRAYLHQRLMQTITGIEDAIIDVVIGRAAFPRIMGFAKQVAGGRVGCLREHWR